MFGIENGELKLSMNDLIDLTCINVLLIFIPAVLSPLCYCKA